MVETVEYINFVSLGLSDFIDVTNENIYDCALQKICGSNLIVWKDNTSLLLIKHSLATTHINVLFFCQVIDVIR